MKKLFLLALLLGLTGCGDNNQGDTSQANAQTPVEQTALAAPVAANYSLAATPRMMTATALPLGGWTGVNLTPLGASSIWDAVNGNRVSVALITPNAAEVAKVLRGGAAGIALSLAVDQLLGAVDWILDPANNRIVYQPNNSLNCQIQSCSGKYLWFPAPYMTGNTPIYYPGPSDAVVIETYKKYLTTPPGNAVKADVSIVSKTIGESSATYNVLITMVNQYGGSSTFDARFYFSTDLNPEYDDKPKHLSLNTVAEQVISNADADSLDAQVATGLAAQNILNEAYNDDAKAEPIVNELENNANKNCTKHEIKMDTQAALVEWRYEEMYEDRYNLYQNHYEVSNPLILNGVNKGSWLGHVSQYQYAQGILRKYIKNANDNNCPTTPKAAYWVDKAPPPEPGVNS